MIRRRALALVLALVFVVGCVAPRALRWPGDLPVYQPPELGDPPTSEVVAVLAGDPAPVDGFVVPADYFVWLEAVALEAAPEIRTELERSQVGRADDRAFASEEYARAVAHLRRQLGPICALCGGLGAAAGGGIAGGACSSLP